jgi:hypothetical protein
MFFLTLTILASVAFGAAVRIAPDRQSAKNMIETFIFCFD